MRRRWEEANVSLGATEKKDRGIRFWSKRLDFGSGNFNDGGLREKVLRFGVANDQPDKVRTGIQ